MTVPIDPDRTLVERLEAMGKVTTYGKELSSGEEVGDLYPEPPSRKDLQVVVQCLAPSSPNGECRWLIVPV